MGFWGIGTFENDNALDWLNELEEINNISFIEETLEKAVIDYLEAPQGCKILAAIEIILALLTSKCEDLPENAKEWLSKNKKLKPAYLKKKAFDAIDKVLSTDSELNELWKESDEYKPWQKHVEQMKINCR